MNDIFGKVIAVLAAAVIFCGMPLMYMKERLKSASQMYLLSESTQFVDNICNTGFLSLQMWQQFYKQMAPVEGICEIKLLHETKDLVYVEEEDIYRQVSTFYDEQDILAVLEQEGTYPFARNDFLRITVSVDDGTKLWLKDQTQNVSYGGVVKYEAY